EERLDFEEIRAFAYGSLGWTPRDFATFKWRDYLLACRGYYKQQELNQSFLRRHAYIVSAAQIGSSEAGKFVNDAWPITEEEKDSIETTEDFRDRMLRLTEEVLKKEAQKAGTLAQA
ncbi:MAG TPA: hypothetical protein VFT06_00230, partial [Flavisolibacter sp.]|nr:hypothetical protein [Flavisolibacter sp.]